MVALVEAVVEVVVALVVMVEQTNISRSAQPNNLGSIKPPPVRYLHMFAANVHRASEPALHCRLVIL